MSTNPSSRAKCGITVGISATTLRWPKFHTSFTTVQVWGMTKTHTARKESAAMPLMISFQGEGSMMEKKSILRCCPSKETRTAPMKTVQTMM